MTGLLFIRRLLAIVLIAGLVLAPLIAPASAAASMSMEMASMDMSSMPDDMPCCPDKSMPGDCDKCPLMAICALKTFQALPVIAVADVLPTSVRMLAPRSDADTDSLGHPPPPRPPRTLVRSA